MCKCAWEREREREGERGRGGRERVCVWVWCACVSVRAMTHKNMTWEVCTRVGILPAHVTDLTIYIMYLSLKHSFTDLTIYNMYLSLKHSFTYLHPSTAACCIINCRMLHYQPSWLILLYIVRHTDQFLIKFRPSTHPFIRTDPTVFSKLDLSIIISMHQTMYIIISAIQVNLS